MGHQVTSGDAINNNINDRDVSKRILSVSLEKKHDLNT